ncbi:endolytic transglycosylase MltG [Inquilinus limosus]|uniref:Endolytic murein transglycosylase n=1 Tax=Inquilinus limosus TaxID=171674 RepID=A0A211ZPC4_9PROT|nr:endolytic transglycosylase MltG [Inquilinus limosus]OWJ67138.1 aminodeoxychorismate lyase [Inquilinus limosus]
MLRALARALAFLVVLAAVIGGGVAWFLHSYRAPGPLTAPATLVIERGSGLTAIAAQLETAGVIENRWVFLAGAALDGGDRSLKAGEYAFAAGISPADAADLLARGSNVSHKITVAEGLTSAEIAALVQGEPLLTGEVGDIPAEGTLLPETYQFIRGDTRPAVIDRMRKAMRQELDALWARRTNGLPFKSPQEAVTMASIVEKETGVPAERPTVASVFLNRLQAGMPLQADPTVIYALTQGRKPLGRPLTRADWKLDSPYNTYLVAGLPPGPIANPGRDALAAVLKPAVTDYYYFVADGSGGHVFARTLEEHNRNVAEWQKRRQATPPTSGDAAPDTGDKTP